MNRQELTAVILLFAGLIAYMTFFRTPAASPGPSPAATAAEQQATSPEDAALESAAEETPVADVPLPVEVAAAAAEADAVMENLPEDSDVAVTNLLPEETVLLENNAMAATFSSRGGRLLSVELKDYPATKDNGGNLALEFGDAAALEWSGIPAFSASSDGSIVRTSESGLVVRTASMGGLQVERHVSLEANYRLHIVDTFTNSTESVITLPAAGLSLGPMVQEQTKAKQQYAYLGVDTLAAQGGEKVAHWSRKGRRGDPNLAGLFQPEYRRGGIGCMKAKLTEPLPERVSRKMANEPLAWIAVKNKFFVQILSSDDDLSQGYVLKATRRVPPQEDPEMPQTWSGAADIKNVSAEMLFPAAMLNPGASLTRSAAYYVGPKKYNLLRQLGRHQADVMEFGFFKPICIVLLRTLNAIYIGLPNYGVAIILLTIMVRVLFWPVTHKSTESMKKMQTLQPEVTKIREKFKDKPQKMNQEVMALYKENKVNPMAGCLPMLVQIPVFIALFTVLRSAVELRFEGFLAPWIKDLSEPEGLFAGSRIFAVIPFIDSLNILPLFMTGLTVLQQRMTPTAGDPQQQKMMAMMPIFFLFLFYNMPSALVLYWSTSQCLSVLQMWLQHRRPKVREAAATA